MHSSFIILVLIQRIGCTSTQASEPVNLSFERLIVHSDLF
jgi:hypothetical protein